MEKTFKIIGTTITLSVVVIIVLGIMAFTKTGFAIINDGERGVLKTGTKYDMTELQPGYHFFIPIWQTVDVKTIRPKLINYSRTEANKEDSELLLFEPMLEGLDSKGIPIKLALSIEVKPVADQLAEMYKADGDFENSFYKKVKQPNREAVQATISKFSVDSIMDKRSEVEKSLTELIKVSYARNPYFKLEGINLKDIVVPEEIRKKQLEVQAAKQDALKSLELVKKAENEAKSREAKAQGDANAMKIEAQGKADSVLIEATAQAKANKLIADSITDKVIKVQSIEAWKAGGSQVPKVGATIPFIGKVEDLNTK
jgi:regulator of protease activity HflC (stomatin/prohibitin superfamily)